MRNLAAVLTAAAIGLAGCGSGTEVVTPTVTETVTLTEQVIVPESEIGPTSSIEQAGITKPFGSTFTWNDNISVTVSEPVEAALSDYYKFELYDGYEIVMVEVTVRNDSPVTIETMDIITVATTGNEASSPVDDADAMLFNPWVPVLPGEEITFQEAWTALPGEEFVLRVTYGMTEAHGYYSTVVDFS